MVQWKAMNRRRLIVITAASLLLASGCSDPKVERIDSLRKEIAATEAKASSLEWSAKQQRIDLSTSEASLMAAQAVLQEADAALSAKTSAEQAPYKKMIEWDTHLRPGTGNGWRQVYEGRKHIYEEDLPRLKKDVDDKRAALGAIESEVEMLHKRAADLRAELRTLSG